MVEAEVVLQQVDRRVPRDLNQIDTFIKENYIKATGK